MKKNMLIVLNAIVYNRGSEALVRGISKICKEQNSDLNITLVSSEEEFGSWINIENVDEYQKKINYPVKSIRRYIVAVLQRLKINVIVNHLKYSKLKKLAKKQDIVLIVGADNYDITYGMQEDMYKLHKYLRKNNDTKMILYDCSFAERDVTETFKKDILNFDKIIVRETISKENISKIVDENKLCLFPDPAFIMDSEKVELPKIFKNKSVVGINVSNLITNPKYGSQVDMILRAYTNMMEYILNNTDKNIVLVPHVMNNADLSTLKELYKNYENNERVHLIENEAFSAKQLKYIISNCELYVGARTHSTIAAYSTCVPTLVLGYSVKSRGIATDLFGTDKDYVLPVSGMETDQCLVEGFKWLTENKDKIQKQLKDKMPEYQSKTREVFNVIKDI